MIIGTDQAKEEVEALEKKMQQLENELAQTQQNLETATKNLEEKEKALQNVSDVLLLLVSRACLNLEHEQFKNQ